MSSNQVIYFTWLREVCPTFIRDENFSLPDVVRLVWSSSFEFKYNVPTSCSISEPWSAEMTEYITNFQRLNNYVKTIKSWKLHYKFQNIVNKVLLHLNGTLHRELVPYDFQWLFCIQKQWFLYTRGPCLKVVFEFEWVATYFGLLRAKLILAPLCMPKWVWPSMNRCRMVFVQNFPLPPSMHGRCCMQNNQLLTKSHVELEDNSNYITLLFSFIVCHIVILQSKLLHKINAYNTWWLHYILPWEFVMYRMPPSLSAQRGIIFKGRQLLSGPFVGV